MVFDHLLDFLIRTNDGVRDYIEKMKCVESIQDELKKYFYVSSGDFIGFSGENIIQVDRNFQILSCMDKRDEITIKFEKIMQVSNEKR